MASEKKYNQEFKDNIIRLYFKEGRSIKSLNEEYQLGEGTVRKWVRSFQEECEKNPELKNKLAIYEENRQLRKELEELKKENIFLKKAAAFFKKKIVSNNTNS